MKPLVAVLLASWCVAILLVWTPSDLFARESERSPTSSTHSSGHHASQGRSHLKAASSVPLDWHGRIKRSTEAKHAFKKSHPCPSTGKPKGACPGYVIDHIQALKHGGRDAPDDIQWQTVQEAKIKDRTE
jgi:hypothetical protein